MTAPRRRGWLLLVPVVAILGLAVGALWRPFGGPPTPSPTTLPPEPPPMSIFAFADGTCFAEYADAWQPEFTAVPCDEPHAAVLLGRVPVSRVLPLARPTPSTPPPAVNTPGAGPGEQDAGPGSRAGAAGAGPAPGAGDGAEDGDGATRQTVAPRITPAGTVPGAAPAGTASGVAPAASSPAPGWPGDDALAARAQLACQDVPGYADAGQVEVRWPRADEWSTWQDYLCIEPTPSLAPSGSPSPSPSPSP